METIFRLLLFARFVLLRYETEHVPCTGITAVTKQERRHFDRGVMIAPWHSMLPQAKEALANGTVVDTGFRFSVQLRPADIVNVAVLLSNDAVAMPVIYLAAEPFFAGYPTLYDAFLLIRDALVFGSFVSELLRLSNARELWISGADWECVPALELLRTRYVTLLVLHNVFDTSMGIEQHYPGFRMFRDRTALQVGMENADVVAAVNQGFAASLRQDAFYRLVLARHLQPFVSRVVGIDNAAFSPLTSEQEQLIESIAKDPVRGMNEVREMKRAAKAKLPADLTRRVGDRVLLISMGRRSAQKQHDVTVESIRNLLRQDPNLPIFTVFATTGGSPCSQERLAKIKELAADFPHAVACIDGRIDFYSDLVTVADFNVMSSLWEPHGSAFEGLVVPVARAVDGLLAQISAFHPQGVARSLNDEWHNGDPPSGFLFREEPLSDPKQERAQYQALLDHVPSPKNELFDRVVNGLSATLLAAIQTKLHDEVTYSRLLRAALLQQKKWSWKENFAMQLALIRDARNRRTLPSE